LTYLAARFNGFRGAQARREIGRFLKYATVGVWGFAVDFGILNFLIFVAYFPPWFANTCSFSIAVLNTFTFNRLWTMPESRQRPIREQLPQFFLVNLVGYAINETIFLGSHALIWQHFLPTALAWNFAKAAASGVALFWNFSANRLWTWRGL